MWRFGLAIQSIVVTSRRVAERLQDVPISIVALTDKDLLERGVNSLVDLALLTPGLSYSTDFGRVGERPTVRGISVSRLDAPQPVSVFIDGVYVRDGALDSREFLTNLVQGEHWVVGFSLGVRFEI